MMKSLGEEMDHNNLRRRPDHSPPNSLRNAKVNERNSSFPSCFVSHRVSKQVSDVPVIPCYQLEKRSKLPVNPILSSQHLPMAIVGVENRVIILSSKCGQK